MGGYTYGKLKKKNHFGQFILKHTNGIQSMLFFDNKFDQIAHSFFTNEKKKIRTIEQHNNLITHDTQW